MDLGKFDHLSLPLDNGMEVLLCSKKSSDFSGSSNSVRDDTDSDVDISSVALAVKAGFLNEPDNLPGAAHLDEHCLFRGSSKHPGVTEFDQFLDVNFGESNGETRANSTMYSYKVRTDKLGDSLEHFSNLIKDPTFRLKDVLDEILMLGSEFSLKRRDETTILDYMITKMTKDKAPLGRFSWGTSASLAEAGKNPELLREFFRKHYSANLMKVVIISSLSLNDLVGLVKKYFLDIPTIEGAGEISGPYGKRDFQLDLNKFSSVYKVQSQCNSNILCLTWAVQPEFQKMRNPHPVELLVHYWTQERRNSLFDILLQEGLATGTTGRYDTSDINCEGLTVFNLIVKLTEQGLQNYTRIIYHVYQCIRWLSKLEKDDMIKLWLEKKSDEAKQDDELDEKDLAEKFADYMVLFENANNIAKEEEFKQDNFTELLHRLEPHNMNVTILSPLFQQLFPPSAEHDRLFKIKYTREKLPELPDQTNTVNKTRTEFTFAATDNNPYMNELTKQTRKSRRVGKNKNCKMTCRIRKSTGDDFPMVLFTSCEPSYTDQVVNISLFVNNGYLGLSPLNSAAAAVYVAALELNLKADFNLAAKASVKCSISLDSKGILFNFQGQNSVVQKFVSDIIVKISSYKLSQTEFKIVHDLVAVESVIKFTTPSTLAKDYLNKLTSETYWTMEAKIEQLVQMNFSDVMELVKALGASSTLIVLSVGCASINDTVDWAFNICKDFRICHGAHGTMLHHLPSLPAPENLKMCPTNQNSLKARVMNRIHDDENSFICNAYIASSYLNGNENRRLTEKQIKDSCHVMILKELLDSRVYFHLRTVQVLGYAVECHLYNNDKYSLPIGVLVDVCSQSYRFDGEDINNRIDNFVTEVVRVELPKLSEKRFQELMSLASETINKGDLEDDSRRLWCEIRNRSLNFTLADKLEKEFEKITFQSFCIWSKSFIAKSSQEQEGRKKVTIQLNGNVEAGSQHQEHQNSEERDDGYDDSNHGPDSKRPRHGSGHDATGHNESGSGDSGGGDSGGGELSGLYQNGHDTSVEQMDVSLAPEASELDVKAIQQVASSLVDTACASSRLAQDLYKTGRQYESTCSDASCSAHPRPNDEFKSEKIIKPISDDPFNDSQWLNKSLNDSDPFGDIPATNEETCMDYDEYSVYDCLNVNKNCNHEDEDSSLKNQNIQIMKNLCSVNENVSSPLGRNETPECAPPVIMQDKQNLCTCTCTYRREIVAIQRYQGLVTTHKNVENSSGSAAVDQSKAPAGGRGGIIEDHRRKVLKLLKSFLQQNDNTEKEGLSIVSADSIDESSDGQKEDGEVGKIQQQSQSGEKSSTEESTGDISSAVTSEILSSASDDNLMTKPDVIPAPVIPLSTSAASLITGVDVGDGESNVGNFKSPLLIKILGARMKKSATDTGMSAGSESVVSGGGEEEKKEMGNKSKEGVLMGGVGEVSEKITEDMKNAVGEDSGVGFSDVKHAAKSSKSHTSDLNKETFVDFSEKTDTRTEKNNDETYDNVDLYQSSDNINNKVITGNDNDGVNDVIDILDNTTPVLNKTHEKESLLDKTDILADNSRLKSDCENVSAEAAQDNVDLLAVTSDKVIKEKLEPQPNTKTNEGLNVGQNKTVDNCDDTSVPADIVSGVLDDLVKKMDENIVIQQSKGESLTERQNSEVIGEASQSDVLFSADMVSSVLRDFTSATVVLDEAILLEDENDVKITADIVGDILDNVSTVLLSNADSLVENEEKTVKLNTAEVESSAVEDRLFKADNLKSENLVSDCNSRYKSECRVSSSVVNTADSGLNSSEKQDKDPVAGSENSAVEGSNSFVNDVTLNLQNENIENTNDMIVNSDSTVIIAEDTKFEDESRSQAAEIVDFVFSNAVSLGCANGDFSEGIRGYSVEAFVGDKKGETIDNSEIVNSDNCEDVYSKCDDKCDFNDDDEAKTITNVMNQGEGVQDIGSFKSSHLDLTDKDSQSNSNSEDGESCETVQSVSNAEQSDSDTVLNQASQIVNVVCSGAYSEILQDCENRSAIVEFMDPADKPDHQVYSVPDQQNCLLTADRRNLMLIEADKKNASEVNKESIEVTEANSVDVVYDSDCTVSAVTNNSLNSHSTAAENTLSYESCHSEEGNDENTKAGIKDNGGIVDVSVSAENSTANQNVTGQSTK